MLYLHFTIGKLCTKVSCSCKSFMIHHKKLPTFVPITDDRNRSYYKKNRCKFTFNKKIYIH